MVSKGECQHDAGLRRLRSAKTSMSPPSWTVTFDLVTHPHQHATVSKKLRPHLCYKLTLYSHLLGKKSWNVYNQDNIVKVRRDEAEARLREEEQERRMQAVDADRRLQILRGEPLEALPEDAEQKSSHKREREDGGQHRKRRRIGCEDDTDRDMRLARQAAAGSATEKSLPKSKRRDAPIVDHKGHISLFPEEQRRPEKNAEAESEAAKKKREYEDQYTMRFSNAAGMKQSLESPWYSTSTNGESALLNLPGKDVWGNDDPRRKEREQKRLDTSDPLAVMKKGVKQLREADKQRQQWKAEREKDLKEVEEMAREQRRRRRHEDEDEDSLEDFTLDTGYQDTHRKRRKHHSDHSNKRRHGRRGGHWEEGSAPKHRSSKTT